MVLDWIQKQTTAINTVITPTPQHDDVIHSIFNEKTANALLAVVLCVLFALLALTLTALSVCCWRKRKRRMQRAKAQAGRTPSAVSTSYTAVSDGRCKRWTASILTVLHSTLTISDPEAASNMTSYQETRTADPSRTDVAVAGNNTPEHFQLLNQTSLSLGSSHTGSDESTPATPFTTGIFQLTGSFAPLEDDHDNHKT